MTMQWDRRRFLGAMAASAAAFVRSSTAQARRYDHNGKLRVAAIGTGNKGRSDLEQVAASPRVDVVALCNVDHSKEHLGWAVEKFPCARVFTDYRCLFDRSRLFDAVIVATPDHMHAPIALAAMQLGKHVYCEKPLTHTVDEARSMRRAAERHRVVTQMGNQIQSHRFYRNAVQLVRGGAIGKVREVHSWQAGKNIWVRPQGRLPAADCVPPQLDWNRWLGVAHCLPYRDKLYHPRNWRTWQEFGTGQLGDFGCHIFDPVFQALDLASPISIEADNAPLADGLWTLRCKVQYRFPGTPRTAGDLLSVTWYDGEDHKPDREGLGLPERYQLPQAGSVLIGEEGTLVIPHVDRARLFPREKFRDYERPQLDDVSHYTSWVDASLDQGRTTSNFAYAAPLTEAVLLGVIATRFPGEQLQWDSAAARFVHHADANRYLANEYRRGW